MTWNDLLASCQDLAISAGHPFPSPCPGAFLCGDGIDERERKGPLRIRHGIEQFLVSIHDEPRLRRLVDLPRPTAPQLDVPLPPPWTVAAASWPPRKRL